MKRFTLLLTVCMVSTLLSGCLFNFSPEYTPPVMQQPIPTAYKSSANWKEATPGDSLDRGNWWAMFNDQTLNRLMAELNTSNLSIAKAAASYRKARANIGTARSAFFPTISGPGSITKTNKVMGIETGYSYGVNTRWELSLWNTLPAYEASAARSESTAADYANIILAMQGELAQSYFQLRVLDSQHQLYQSTIETYAKALQLTRSQFQGGIVTAGDVAQAEAQLASAEAQLAELDRQRAQYETTIAILVGRIPATFSLERAGLDAVVPNIPRAVPSTLLERRPDIAAAERLVAAANQEIGVARGAWFPTINLSADRIIQTAAWLTSPVTVWSLGPSAALTLFQGGKRLAESDAAQANYEYSVANYRQIVLEAFKEVEDNLSGLGYLEKQLEAQNRAVTASQTALRLSLSQYRGGMTTYLQVVSDQTSVLNNKRSAIQTQGQRLIAAVNLIKALGGGWDRQALSALSQTANIPQAGVINR